MGHKVNPQMYRLGTSVKWSYHLRGTQGFLSNLLIHRLILSVFIRYSHPHFTFSHRRNNRINGLPIQPQGEKQLFLSPFLAENLVYSHSSFGSLGKRFYLDVSMLDITLDILLLRRSFTRNNIFYPHLQRNQNREVSFFKNPKLLKLKRRVKRRARLFFYLRSRKMYSFLNKFSRFVREKKNTFISIPRLYRYSPRSIYNLLLYSSRRRISIIRKKVRRLEAKKSFLDKKDLGSFRKRLILNLRRRKIRPRRNKSKKPSYYFPVRLFRRKRYPLWLLNFSPWKSITYLRLGGRWIMLKYLLRLYPHSFFLPQKKKLFFNLLLWQLIGVLSYVQSRPLGKYGKRVNKESSFSFSSFHSWKYPFRQFSSLALSTHKGYFARKRRFVRLHRYRLRKRKGVFSSFTFKKRFKPFHKVRSNIIIKIISFTLWLSFFFSIYGKFLRSTIFRHFLFSRFFYLKHLAKWFSFTLRNFFVFSQFSFSFSGLNRHHLSASLLLHYIIIKLGQYFQLSSILKPLLRFIRRDPLLRGFRLVAAGRLTRQERASFIVRSYKRMPFSNRTDAVDYAMGQTKTRYGAVGLKIFLRRKKVLSPVYFFRFFWNNCKYI